MRLRTIWRLIGTGDENTRVALAYGRAGDVNFDAHDDFFVTRGMTWHLFLGGDSVSQIPAWSFVSQAHRLNSDPQALVGDFLGNDTSLVGLRDDRCNDQNGACYFRVQFFRPDAESLLATTSYVLDISRQPSGFRTYASDLDRDGADELVVVNKEDNAVVVRVYQGGRDFQLEVPSWEFRTLDSIFSQASDQTVYSTITYVDHDNNSDLVVATLDAVSGQNNVAFWWGKSGSVNGFWSAEPDRIISAPSTETSLFARDVEYSEDLDGDDIADFSDREYFGDNPGVNIWLSRGHESARTREYTAETVDLLFPDALRRAGFGYVADSLQRYQMLTLLNLNEPRDAYGLGGGVSGPNFTYDAYLSGRDGPQHGGIYAGDINGDGWSDRLVADAGYGGPVVGGAVIVAGGPYIPSDDPTVSVREAPVAGVAAGMHLWPNPVLDRLHIAWRRDLPQMPRCLQIFDLQGRLVSETPLATWSGIIELSLAEHPSGTYTALVLDPERRPLGDVTFIIQR